MQPQIVLATHLGDRCHIIERAQHRRAARRTHDQRHTLRMRWIRLHLGTHALQLAHVHPSVLVGANVHDGVRAQTRRDGRPSDGEMCVRTRENRRIGTALYTPMVLTVRLHQGIDAAPAIHAAELLQKGHLHAQGIGCRASRHRDAICLRTVSHALAQSCRTLLFDHREDRRRGKHMDRGIHDAQQHIT